MNLKHSLLLTITLTLLAGVMQATTYYVSTEGDNANDGLSEATSWSSVQFAIDSASAGDTVLLDGIFEEQISFNKVGTAGSPIVLSSLNVGGATIKGSVGGSDTLIVVSGGYIVISGLHLTGVSGDNAVGILVNGDADGVQIRGNDIDTIGSGAGEAYGIIVLGGDSTIIDLVIANNLVKNNAVGAGAGISVDGDVPGFSITGNDVNNSDSTGIRVGASGGSVVDNNVRFSASSGIEITGNNNIVDGNLVTNNGVGVLVQGSSSGSIVRNNFIYANWDQGVKIDGSTVGVVIRNNTLLKNDSNLVVNVSEISVSGATDVEIFNNIIYAGATGFEVLSVATGSTVAVDYNIYWSKDSSTLVIFDVAGTQYNGLEDFQSTTQDSNSLFINPKLVSAAGGVDFQIADATSPAINAGDTTQNGSAGAFDGYGKIRIFDGAIDIGANEYDGVLPVTFLKPFSARLMNRGVELKWHTAEEILNERFDVERSSDLVSWTPVTTLGAKGHSFAYEAMDQHPLFGVSYYRLIQVDQDGTTSISALQQIFVDKSGDVTVFPNPVSDFIQVRGIETAERVVLVNMAGQIQQQWSQVSDGQSLDVRGVNAGLYILQVQEQGETRNIKLLLD